DFAVGESRTGKVVGTGERNDEGGRQVYCLERPIFRKALHPLLASGTNHSTPRVIAAGQVSRSALELGRFVKVTTIPAIHSSFHANAVRKVKAAANGVRRVLQGLAAEREFLESRGRTVIQVRAGDLTADQTDTSRRRHTTPQTRPV